MSYPKEGGSAFPSEQGQTQDGTWNQTFDPGMSLRDYFAAKAIGCFPLDQADVAKLQAGIAPQHQAVAKFCYALADAMLSERDRKGGQAT
jgi:hypothetical protein